MKAFLRLLELWFGANHGGIGGYYFWKSLCRRRPHRYLRNKLVSKFFRR